MNTVLAYIDPGTGSQIAAILTAGFAAVVVTAGIYWDRLLRFLRIRKDKPEVAQADTASSTDSA